MEAAGPPPVASWQTLLHALRSGDNRVRSEAESVYTQWQQVQPLALCQELCLAVQQQQQPAETEVEAVGLRMLCAVLLRQIFRGSAFAEHYALADPATHAAVKEEVLQRMMQESHAHTRRLLARAATQLAGTQLMIMRKQARAEAEAEGDDGGAGEVDTEAGSQGPWDELVDLALSLTARGEQGEEQAMGLFLLETLSETTGSNIVRRMGQQHSQGMAILHVLGNSMQNATSPAQTAATSRAVCSFAYEVAACYAAQESSTATGAAYATQRAAIAEAWSMCQTLTAHVVGALEHMVQAGEELLAQDSLKVLIDLGEKHARFLKSLTPDIGQATLNMAAAEELEPSTRILALELWSTLLSHLPAIVQVSVSEDSGTIAAGQERQLETLQNTALVLMRLIADIDEETPQTFFHTATDDARVTGTEDEDAGDVATTAVVCFVDFAKVVGSATPPTNGSGEEGGLTAAGSAGGKGATRSVPGAALVNYVMEAIGQHGLLESADWRQRRTALFLCALLSSGCSHAMYNYLPSIMPSLLPFAQDDHPRVRYAFFSMLFRFAANFVDPPGGMPNLTTVYGEGLFPLLIDAAKEHVPFPRILSTILNTLQAMCNPNHSPEDVLEPHSAALFQMVGTILSTSWDTAPPVVKANAVPLMALLAANCPEAFVACAPNVVQVLSDLVFMDTEEVLQQIGDEVKSAQTRATVMESISDTRGLAMDTLATLGRMIPLEVFQEPAHNVAQFIVERVLVPADAAVASSGAAAPAPGDGDGLVDTVVLAFAHKAMARLASVLREGFVQYLPHTIPCLLRIISTPLEVDITDADMPPTMSASLNSSASSSTAAASSSNANMDTYQHYERGVGDMVVKVNNAQMMEKQAALQSLFEYITQLGDLLYPHLTEVFDAVAPCLRQREHDKGQVISAAIVPLLLELGLRAGGTAAPAADPAEATALAQKVFAESVGTTCAAIVGESRSHTSLYIEPLCVMADSLRDLVRLMRESQYPVRAQPLGFRVQVEMTEAEMILVANVFHNQANHSIQRSLDRSQRAATGDYDLTTDLEWEEAESWERDMMLSCGDGIGWLIKSCGERIAPILGEMIFPFILPLLECVEEAELLNFSTCAMIDSLEYGGPAVWDIMVQPAAQGELPPPALTLLTSLLRGLTESVDVAGCAMAYGLGVFAEAASNHAGVSEIFDQHQARATQQLLQLLDAADASAQARQQNAGGGVGGEDAEGQDDDDDDMSRIRDNTVSALLKIAVLRTPDNTQRVQLLEQAVYPRMPLMSDLYEAHDAHRFLLQAVLDDTLRPAVTGESGEAMQSLIQVFLGCMVIQEAEGPGVLGEDGNADMSLAYKDSEWFWERQLVDRNTRQGIEEFLQAWLNSLPPEVAQALVASLPEAIQQCMQIATEQISV